MSVTWKEACELIAKYFNETKGANLTGQDVFNYSPTGELFMIPTWYEEAKTFYKLN